MNIFVLDDYKNDREMLAAPFRAQHDVRCASDLEDAIRVLEHWWPDVALVDAIFPRKRNGGPVFAVQEFLEFLEAKRATYLDMPQVILVSGQNDTAKRFDEVRQWLTFGRIADVMPKSTADIGIEFFRSVVQLRVERLLDRQRWRSLYNSAESDSEWFAQLDIITRSPRMLALKIDLLTAARVSGCVLISGPVGCGKELFAKAIHSLANPGKPFKEENCGAIAPELFEAEMFGIQERGKNNIVYADKPGLFKAVADGTLFLDEIHNLDFRHQAKLLQVLQERKFRPVGATDHIPFVGKFVSASNENLAENIENGKFREDLYSRIAAFTISVPGLKDRPEDIPILTEYFLNQFVRARRENGEPCPDMRLHPETLAMLCAFPWRRNVRQLKNAIETAAAFTLVTSPGSGTGATVTPNSLVKSDAAFGEMVPRISSQDAVLSRSGLRTRQWSELKEEKIHDVELAISALLSDVGKARFEALRHALRPRKAEDGPSAPGRDSQDPATIHCMKALLYMLIRDDHRANIQDLLAVVGLSAWETGKKILTVLAAEHPGVTGYDSFVKLPSPGARQEAELLNGIVHAQAALLGPSGFHTYAKAESAAN